MNKALRGLCTVLTIFLLLAPLNFAGASSGFVTSPLWLSPETLKENDMATLYAAFRNTEDVIITADVSFFDGEVLLGKKSITVSPNQVMTTSVTFKVMAGEHAFSATIVTINRADGTGKITPSSSATTTAKLPEQFVSKKIDLTAQAAGGESGSESVILKEVDKAEKAVLAVIPESTKETVGGVASAVDSWREAKAESFSTSAKAAKHIADTGGPTKTIKAETVLGSKELEVKDSPTGSFTGPLSYIKYFFFHTLAWVFNLPILFYLLALVLLYCIFRFIFRKIGKLIRKNKAKPEA